MVIKGTMYDSASRLFPKNGWVWLPHRVCALNLIFSFLDSIKHVFKYRLKKKLCRESSIFTNIITNALEKKKALFMRDMTIRVYNNISSVCLNAKKNSDTWIPALHSFSTFWFIGN